MGLKEQADEATGVLQTVHDNAVRASEQIRAALPTAYEPAADVDESPTKADRDVPVHEAWQRMMQDVQWLSKGRKGRDYMYRGIDDVMNLVGPAERKHGVFVMPTGIEPTFETISTKSGAVMNYCRAVCQFTIYGPRGDTMFAIVLGEAFDNGDKSGTKAQSIALRTLYLNALAIQTNEPARDTEYGQQHELAGPARPTVSDYVGEILAEDTKLIRLRQIKEELKADRRLAMTEVDDGFGGQPITLFALVQRVGTERAQKGGA